MAGSIAEAYTTSAPAGGAVTVPAGRVDTTGASAATVPDAGSIAAAGTI